MNNPIKVEIPREVAQAIEQHLQNNPGHCWLAKLSREQFDGTNASTSGTLYVELGAIPASVLPKMRELVTKAREDRKKVPRGAARA